MLPPSLYPKPSIKSNRTIVSCNKCDICKNFLITDSKFRCTVTGKTYFIKGNLSCDMKDELLILSRDLESTNLTLRLTKIVVVLQDSLITNVAVLIINMLI